MDSHLCICGSYINLRNYRDSAEEAAYADGDDVYLEEEVECEACGARYEIGVEATITVTSDILSIECIYEPNSELHGVDLSTLTIGNSVDAPDGTYQIGANQYCIEEGVLITVFNSQIDENQLQLEL